MSTTGQGRVARYNPATRRHAWVRLRDQGPRRCEHCGLLVVARTDGKMWWHDWRWPDNTVGSNHFDPKGHKVPPCPGPDNEYQRRAAAA